MMSCTDRYLSAPFGSFANNYPHFDVINWPVGTSCGCVTETPHEPQRQHKTNY